MNSMMRLRHIQTCGFVSARKSVSKQRTVVSGVIQLYPFNVAAISALAIVLPGLVAKTVLLNIKILFLFH